MYLPNRVESVFFRYLWELKPLNRCSREGGVEDGQRYGAMYAAEQVPVREDRKARMLNTYRTASDLDRERGGRPLR